MCSSDLGGVAGAIAFMRININLATQPYEDVRSFATRLGLLVGLLVIVTGGLVFATFSGWRNTRDVVQNIDQHKAQMAAMDKEISAGQSILNRPENKAVRDQSAFLNELIARKTFSWTRVFADLEKMMPPRVHVISIQPELDEQNQLELKMTVAGDSRDKIIELLHRMEGSKQFRAPQLTAESAEQSSRGLQFQITAIYLPVSLAQPQGAD